MKKFEIFGMTIYVTPEHFGGYLRFAAEVERGERATPVVLPDGWDDYDVIRGDEFIRLITRECIPWEVG